MSNLSWIQQLEHSITAGAWVSFKLWNESGVDFRSSYLL